MLRTSTRCLLAALGTIAFAAFAFAQTPPDKQAEPILNAARKAYSERNYPAAIEKYREFLKKFAGHAQAPQAKFGLALAYLEMPERKFPEALEQFQQVIANRELPEFPQAAYYVGLIKRSQGLAELAQAQSKSKDAAQHRQNADQRFAEAQQQFAAAAAVLRTRTKFDPAGKELAVEQEWLPRAICDEAEMDLRLGKHKEARQAISDLMGAVPLTRSRYQRLAIYYRGYASFTLGDYPEAARALNRQDIQADPVFGTHAHYLMGRIHQHDGESAEAAMQFQAALDQYARDKAAAQESLKHPEQFKSRPDEKIRLEQLVRSPPEHVVAAAFEAAALVHEAGKFGDAMARFQEFAKQNPDSPRMPEALLHAGICQYQIRQYPEAVATLTPLAQKYPQLADQALLWLGKAQAQVFDPNNPQSKTNAQNAAIATLRQAVDKAGQATDPDVRHRRAVALLELADTQQIAGQNREAAAICEQLLSERTLLDRAEEITERLATAWHLAGDYARSDQVCDQFFKNYPQSPLRPAVAFRQAENAYFIAAHVAKNASPNADVNKLLETAAQRFQAILDTYPEFERLSLVRYSLALCYVQKGDFEKAETLLDAIPQPDRIGDLALVSYQLAICLIKQTPAKAEDAIAAGKVQEHLQAAVQLLDGFASANPQAPEAPDALLKFGHCQQRLSQVMAQPPEKQAALQAARQAYDKLLNQYPKSASMPQAVMERAKTIALAGDRNGAINELRRFTQAPLQDASVAPMAMLRLAVLFREQNQTTEAVKTLDACRKKYETSLAQDKERAAWVPLLKYHHGVALLEMNKVAEAQPLFDQVVQLAADKSLAAESALRSGQCRIQQARQKIESARQKLTTAGSKPDQVSAAGKAVADAIAAAAEAARYLETQCEAFKQALPTAESRARMLYDAAWANRIAADDEVSNIRIRMQADEWRRLTQEATSKNSRSSALTTPEIPRSKIPLQPSEEKARADYKALIADFADLPLAGEARFELSEMFAERDEFAAATALLREALDKEPTQDLTDRIRLRLGACLAAQKDAKGALTQFELIADPKNPLFPQAQYRAGEALLELNKPADAAKRLAIFRDRGEFQNIAGLTDRALFRLGFALAKMEQWEPSRQAYEIMVSRFSKSPWVTEARYGMARARQKMKQYDDAVNWYTQVTNATTSELAANAYLEIGRCRIEQKRYTEALAALLIIPQAFDIPELSGAALYEAARALVEAKQLPQAERVLERVQHDHAGTEWAKLAKERLDALRKR